MAHCCVGYLFDGDVEARGDGFLISCDRCASFKMPLRNSYVSTRDAVTGKLTFKGNAVKHTKGVPYLVDCAITGSDVGTATKPCFPLKKLWQYTLIPAIAQLVDTGGPCEDAIVVVQQDNAGPHIEANYSQWIRDQCDLLGWLYEPQAPQDLCNLNLASMHVVDADVWIIWTMVTSSLWHSGPYTNVLDLYLFPSMSHRHSAHLQRQSNSELPLDRIWQTVESVWKDTVSAELK